MDIRLPILDGYQATRQIRGFNSQVIIIAQTAFAMIGDKQKALDAGCNDYLSKPVSKSILDEVMKKYFPENSK
jgi:CheY-like chemotaxis protein